MKPPEMVLPTFSEDVLQYLSATSPRYPVKFNQKIYILKPNVCIAFAGSVFHFKRLLEDVRQYCKYHNVITSEMLNDFLNGRRDGTWDEFDCLIYVADKVDGNWLRKQTPLYGDIWSIGSGAMDFIRQAMAEGLFSRGDFDNNLQKIVKSNALMLCRILSFERMTLANIEKHWGAGFELVYFADGQFRKLDNITYVINYVDKAGEDVFPLPIAIMNYKYLGENLFITVIKPMKMNIQLDGIRYKITSKEFLMNQFAVVAIDFSSIDHSIKSINPSFDSVYCASSYIIENEKHQKIPAVFQSKPDIEIKFSQNEGLEYSFNTKLIEFLKSV